MDEESEKGFTFSINKLITRYKDGLKDINWDEFEKKYETPTGENYLRYHSLSLIERLYQMVKFQFENSPGRNTAYRSFSAWFKEFGRWNYHKLRGSLGGTLKIDKETLLLFTELSILSTSKDKILTSQLWLELERRGILLDKLSKREVIQFFEKINILEKKSDSGDAQYITRLYK
jgi:DNA phosphorothioation-dependent restriction protein DptG